MIRLACLYFQDNAVDQAAFVKSGSFQTLFTFLSDPSLRFVRYLGGALSFSFSHDRCHVLSMIIVLASGDVLQETKAVSTITKFLKQNIPMDAIVRNADLLKDSLLSLSMIFNSNPSTIAEFGEVRFALIYPCLDMTDTTLDWGLPLAFFSPFRSRC